MHRQVYSPGSSTNYFLSAAFFIISFLLLSARIRTLRIQSEHAVRLAAIGTSDATLPKNPVMDAQLN
ncbi:Uncharacterised protein [Grimontia hollisae]|uniref:Uncharacterized protein n=1 Tax=Grimontia hollisae TaxID=673 RepID=A0A377HR24_GRIHO|nr:Uncharacterised protein [Grimontia hollisae]STO58544.1 Uncharacterised protein [Grimontia hollisae]STQ77962.1 Uncharacterised protein [Grimontia hollisae]